MAKIYYVEMYERGRTADGRGFCSVVETRIYIQNVGLIGLDSDLSYRGREFDFYDNEDMREYACSVIAGENPGLTHFEVDITDEVMDGLLDLTEELKAVKSSLRDRVEKLEALRKQTVEDRQRKEIPQQQQKVKRNTT